MGASGAAVPAARIATHARGGVRCWRKRAGLCPSTHHQLLRRVDFAVQLDAGSPPRGVRHNNVGQVVVLPQALQRGVVRQPPQKVPAKGHHLVGVAAHHGERLLAYDALALAQHAH